MPDTATPRTPARTATVLLALVIVLLLSVAAVSAHPFVRGGGEVPVDSLATITLDLAHGCGSEAAGAGADTLEVALEVPEWLRIVEVADHPGYDHDLEVEEGDVAVVTWLEVGGAQPAPTFDLDVVASGSAGETRYLAVFQGCAEQSYRWIGTPDAPADDPAVRVRLIEADPDRPAPPEAEPEPDADTAEAPSEDLGPVEDADDATTGEAPDEEVDEEAAGDGDDATDDLAATPVPEQAGGNPLRWVVLGVVALIAATVLVLWGRARGRDPRDDTVATDRASDADGTG